MPKSYEGYTPKIDFWTTQQEECFLKSLHLPLFFEAMEPRTGKSKPIIDKTCFHFERPRSPLHVRGALTIANPNGVNRGWTTDACPENVPDRITWQAFTWRSSLSGRVWYKEEFEEFLAVDGLRFFNVNSEALISEDCRKAIGMFLKATERVHATADESSFMEEGGNRCTRIMGNIGNKPQIIMKSCLDGTPVSRAGPLSYFYQVGWLDRRILGFKDFAAYRAHYVEEITSGTWEWREDVKKNALQAYKDPSLVQEWLATYRRPSWGPCAVEKAGGDPHALLMAYAESCANRGEGKHWPDLKKGEDGLPIYRNIEELWSRLDPITYRATFAECFKDVPAPIYQPFYFQLSATQRRVYTQLQEEHEAVLDDETVISAPHHLSRILRAQQIGSNYYPETKGLNECPNCHGAGCERCEELGVIEMDIPLKVIDAKHNPRLDALKFNLEKIASPKVIIWARFQQDAKSVFKLCEEMGMKPVMYNGLVDSEQKAKSLEAFRNDPGAGPFIGNQKSAGKGLPLWIADYHIYYSSQFSWRLRDQSEKRTEIQHRRIPTQIIDLIAEDTVDDLVILPALRASLDIATFVMRDAKRNWL